MIAILAKCLDGARYLLRPETGAEDGRESARVLPGVIKTLFWAGFALFGWIGLARLF